MTDPAAPPLRVLMIGAGRRVRNNFLPALRLLAPNFAVVGIHAPTATRRDELALQWGVPAISSLEHVDLSGIDVVAISVPTSQNAAVLRRLKPSSSTLKLIIDTPIAWSAGELAECSSLLRGFKQMAVAEDYMNFPSFFLMRQAVKAGLVGTPRSLVLNNTGYLYHGLALIRSFVNFKKITGARRYVMASGAVSVHYRVGGIRASVIGPYRAHTTGGIMLQGTSGIITEFDADRQRSGGAGNICVLRPQRDGGRIVGYEIASDGRDMAMPLPALDAMREMDFPDKSDLNLLRGCGLMEVFKSLQDPSNDNCRYTVREAFYDSVISRLATSGRVPFDPFVAFGSDALAPILALTSARSSLRSYTNAH